MRIKRGQPAKESTAEDIFSNFLALHDCKGRRAMPSLYRYAACPLCNLRIHHDNANQSKPAHSRLISKQLISWPD